VVWRLKLAALIWMRRD